VDVIPDPPFLSTILMVS